MSKKIYKYECLGDTLEFAESLGWKEDDDSDNGRDDFVDWLEQDAIEYIEGKGYEVIWND